MKILPDWLKNGYLKVIDPVANWLVRRGVHPNTITVVGTLCTVAGGVIYAMGHISTGGWFLGLDRAVRRARRHGRAPLEQELDVRRVSRFDARPVADGARARRAGGVLRAEPGPPQRADGRGLSRRAHRRVPDVVHPRARRGARHRTRRSAWCSGRSASCCCRCRRRSSVSRSTAGCSASIIVFLTVTAWITVVQRMHFVYRQTTARGDAPPIALSHRKDLLAAPPSSQDRHAPLVSKGD